MGIVRPQDVRMTAHATRAARATPAPRVVRIGVGTGIVRAPDVPMTVPVTKAAATAVRTAGPTQGAHVSCRTAVGRPDATHAARTGPTRVPAGTRSARQAVGPMPATTVGPSPEAARMTVRRPVRRRGAVPSATIALPSAAATATAATIVRAPATIVLATTTTVRATAMIVPVMAATVPAATVPAPPTTALATAATTPGATARSVLTARGRTAGPGWTARVRPPSVAARLTATAPKSPAPTRWSGQLPR